MGDYCNTKVVQSNSQHYQTSRYPHPVYEQCLNVPLYEINQALSYGHPWPDRDIRALAKIKISTKIFKKWS